MIRSFAFSLLLVSATVGAQTTPSAMPSPTAKQKELIALSKQKWLWMAEKNTDELAKLFDDQAIFVHMSRTMTKSEELGVIKSGNIEYRRADIKEVSVRFIGDTAIVLSRIDLHAIVRGKVADNPFSVTETYVIDGGEWKLGALAFSRLATPN